VRGAARAARRSELIIACHVPAVGTGLAVADWLKRR
jgi:hypothetical protein